jgi:hypothetical protein
LQDIFRVLTSKFIRSLGLQGYPSSLDKLGQIKAADCAKLEFARQSQKRIIKFSMKKEERRPEKSTKNKRQYEICNT